MVKGVLMYPQHLMEVKRCCRFTWVDSDPKLIANPQMVKMHLVDTKIHKVDTLVSCKNE
ncbi:hypothetical protein Patl1_30325 [Pistacia atlantica]|uniref:Uncharacterized protein n=1 Tax=Pistacia atlantica TaxID=434234 RepID=A0ACC1ADR8_9ROSI|nr:hypothetical protein Patl1_30325 [Pistacia atlantica]